MVAKPARVEPRVTETARAVTTAIFIVLIVSVTLRFFALQVHLFGFSRTNDEPALSAIAERAPASLELVSISVLVAVIVGLGCALLATRTSRAVVSYLVLALHCTPYFWIVTALQVAAAAHSVDVMSGPLRLLFPATLLGLFLLRATFSVFVAHLGPGAGASATFPAVFAGLATRFGESLPELITAAIVTEIICAWPGEGRIFWVALLQGDFSVVMTLLLLSALFVFAVRLAVRLLQPRARMANDA
jgi:ABC-type dipeptide/oligopeptide/nickel transport system permease component